MGAGCSHSLEAMQFAATADEIKAAVESIEAWQKQQDAIRVNGGTKQAGSSEGPLLSRVGGSDMVKKAVEIFYKKIYADPHLLQFVHDKEPTYLRARQSAFMSWLFGTTSGTPYPGRNVRIAHLRIIRQRGFSPEDLEQGFTYFQEALRELGAPESLISDVMTRVRPFKVQMFTPTARDAEEEARWAREDKERAEALEVAMQQHGAVKLQHSGSAHMQSGSQQPVQSPGSGTLGQEQGSDAGAADAVPRSLSPRQPQCPFTGAFMAAASRPASARGASGGDVCPAGAALLAAAEAKAAPAPAAAQAPAVSAPSRAAHSRPSSALPPTPGAGDANSRPPSASAASPAAAAVGAAARPVPTSAAATASAAAVARVPSTAGAAAAATTAAPEGQPYTEEDALLDSYLCETGVAPLGRGSGRTSSGLPLPPSAYGSRPSTGAAGQSTAALAASHAASLRIGTVC